MTRTTIKPKTEISPWVESESGLSSWYAKMIRVKFCDLQGGLLSWFLTGVKGAHTVHEAWLFVDVASADF